MQPRPPTLTPKGFSGGRGFQRGCGCLCPPSRDRSRATMDVSACALDITVAKGRWLSSKLTEQACPSLPHTPSVTPQPSMHRSTAVHSLARSPPGRRHPLTHTAPSVRQPRTHTPLHSGSHASPTPALVGPPWCPLRPPCTRAHRGLVRPRSTALGGDALH